MKIKKTAIRKVQGDLILPGFELNSKTIINDLDIDYPVTNIRIKPVGADILLNNLWPIPAGTEENLIYNSTDLNKEFEYVITLNENTTPTIDDYVLFMVEFIKEA